MASSEQPPSNHDSELREELASLHTRNCSDSYPDAVCIFMRVHLCIFDKVLKSPLPDMIALNRIFAQTFRDVLQRHYNGQLMEQRRLWRDALLFYHRYNPNRTISSLARMAKAHMLEDLSIALCELEKTTGCKIDEEQYKAVLDVIMGCLASLETMQIQWRSLEDELASTIATHFAAPLRAIIKRWRGAAWKEYQLIRKANGLL